jgi:hypothetical protein
VSRNGVLEAARVTGRKRDKNRIKRRNMETIKVTQKGKHREERGGHIQKQKQWKKESKTGSKNIVHACFYKTDLV